jgi:hypothetical protein
VRSTLKIQLFCAGPLVQVQESNDRAGRARVVRRAAAVIQRDDRIRDGRSRRRTRTRWSPSFTVRCEVGWGETPITDEAARAVSITSLLEWQRLARAQPA